VLIFIPGQATQRAPLYGVTGSDIKDLQILPEASSIVPQNIEPKHIPYQQQRIPQQTYHEPPPQAMPQPPPPTVRRTVQNGLAKQIVYDARAKKAEESSATESAAPITKAKKKKGKQVPPEPIANESATSGENFSFSLPFWFYRYSTEEQCMLFI
jgi:hypothetical protein